MQHGPPAGSPPAPRGRLVARGADANPANRFERLQRIADPDLEPLTDDDLGEPPPVPTLYLRDPTRTLLAQNDSPDLGFDTSLNPYRGCEHGCTYCLAPGTPVLFADLAWRALGDVRVGDELVGFDEHPAESGATLKLRRAVVQKVWWSRKPTLRLISRNSEVVTTADHRWLQSGKHRWSRTDQLAPGRLLRHMPVIAEEPQDDDYRVGYLAGLFLGNGSFREESGWGSDHKRTWRVALIDLEPIARAVEYLNRFGVAATLKPFDSSSRTNSPSWKVEVRSRARLEMLDKLLGTELESRGYRRGFVASSFDAGGSNGHSLQIFQSAGEILQRAQRYANSLGFQFKLERRDGRASSLRLVGWLTDRIRFLSVCQPAAPHKRDAIFGRTPFLAAERIEAIEPGPVADVVDIQNSTGTFYAAGLATHNCYARPTHEYLGFSAGLDFETRILVKEDAPELLRKALESPRWQPRVVALSGVTDAYQPIERKLLLTRRCLEVFAEFRNPVAIITKSALVARDADLLAELAQHGAAAVHVSVTSLDRELQRRLEPRAATPAHRLAAIEKLAAAGVPVGVMVAPLIPGLNDHEMPAILEAAARAGARWAGHVVLRLPHGLVGLFEQWLERHEPLRKERVLARIRDVRGGALNDPRFHSRMRGSGLYAEQLHALFALACRRAGLRRERVELSTAAFRQPADAQLALL